MLIMWKRINQIKEIKKHYEIIIKMDKREKLFDDEQMNKLIILELFS